MNTLTATNVEGIIQDVTRAIEDGKDAKQRMAAGIWEIHQYKLWEKTHLSFAGLIAEHSGSANGKSSSGVSGCSVMQPPLTKALRNQPTPRDHPKWRHEILIFLGLRCRLKRSDR